MAHFLRFSRSAATALAILAASALATSPSAASDPASPLSRKIAVFEARQQPLADVMQTLADLAHINLSIDWKSLEQAGYSKDMPVTVRLHHMAVGKAMQIVLDQVVTENNDLALRLEDGLLTFTTAAKADSLLVTRVYDMNEFTFDPNQSGDEHLPKLLNNSQSQSSSAGSTYVQSGNSSGPFSGGGGGNGNNAQTEQENTTRLTALKELIQTTVRPEIWDINGGTAKITVLAWKSQLIITAPESVQGEIAKHYHAPR